MYLHGYFVLPWGLRKKVVREKAWFLTIPAPYPFAMVISGARNTSWLAMAPPALTFTAFLKSPETEIKTKVSNRWYLAYIVTISWSLDETSSFDTHLSCINTTNTSVVYYFDRLILILFAVRSNPNISQLYFSETSSTFTREIPI